jgi:hypothetical protein
MTRAQSKKHGKIPSDLVPSILRGRGNNPPVPASQLRKWSRMRLETFLRNGQPPTPVNKRF